MNAAPFQCAPPRPHPLQDPVLSATDAFSTPYTGLFSNSDSVDHSGLTIKTACAQNCQASAAYFCNNMWTPLLDLPWMQGEVRTSSRCRAEHSIATWQGNDHSRGHIRALQDPPDSLNPAFFQGVPFGTSGPFCHPLDSMRQKQLLLEL